MRIVNTGVYHRNQNAFSGQTIAAVFLNGTQTGSLPGRNLSLIHIYIGKAIDEA